MPRPADSLKARLTRSLCLSYAFNRRNLERPWYGAWNLALTNLVEDFGNIVVAPQYHLYSDDAEELDKQGDYVDDDSRDELDLFQYDSDEDDPDESFEDPDLTSDSIVTTAGSDFAQRIPDFALIHFMATHLPEDHPRYAQLGGLHITHQCCPLLVEIKPHPSRSRQSKGEAYDKMLAYELFNARDDLSVQCYVLFGQFPHARSVITIAAAGPHWIHRVVLRHEAPVAAGDQLDDSVWARGEWSSVVTLGTSESDRRLAGIHRMLRDKPRLQLDDE